MQKLKLFTFVAILMAAFSASGQVPYFEWARKISCDTCQTGNNTIIYYGKITYKDNVGNMYIVGSLSDSIDFTDPVFPSHDDVGAYIAKYDVNGNKLWEQMFYSGSSITDISHFKVDDQGNIYIGGRFWEYISLGNTTLEGGANSTFIAKLNANNGQVFWAKKLAEGYFMENISIENMVIDNQGNTYILESFADTIIYQNQVYGTTPLDSSGYMYEDNRLLIKCNAVGEVDWVKHIDFHNENEVRSGLALDAAGNIWLAGSFDDTLNVAGESLVSAGLRDMVLLKYAPDGTLLLKKRAGGTGNDNITGIGKSGNGIRVSFQVYSSTADIWGMSVTGAAYVGSEFIAELNTSATATAVNPFKRGIRDSEGNYYVLEYGQYIAKTDSLGNLLWKKSGNFANIIVNAPNDLNAIIYGGGYADGLQTQVGRIYFTKLSIGHEINGTLSRVASASSCADTSGQKLANWVVKSAEGNYALTDENGLYRMGVVKQAATTYHVQPVIPAYLENMAVQVCPTGAQAVSVAESNTPLVVSDKNFGFQIADCHKLMVGINEGRLRPCSKTQTIVWYRNVGTVAAPNAYVLVKFPAYLVPKQSALSWSLVDAATHTYRFELGSVAAGTNTYFTVQDSVLCNAPMGYTLCAQASIYPVSDCPLPSNWNGAAVSVKGSCVGNGMVRLGIYNPTANNMSDSVNYKVYYDSLLIAQKKVKLAASDSLNFQVLANGHTIRLEAEQVANHPTEQQVSVVVEGCVQAGGTVTTGFVDAFSANNTVNTATSCDQVRNSYDPNDKQVFPRGLTSENIVAPNTELEYLIRFQNTGNDTAYVVTVVDTLSEKLDIESLRLGVMSHKGKIDLQTLNGKTYLRWTFANIMLPDSGANQLGSNGFVQFYIKPLSSNALGTKVRNKAAIYFDYNAPVITNETVTTFDNIVYSNPSLGGNVITGSKQNVVNGSWLLWPNPAKGEFHVSLSERSEVTVTDVTGKVYYTQKQEAGANTVRLSDYASGLYFVKVSDSKGVSMKKIVLE
ncbi:conserved repeat domain-containing protein/Por secretion system C-terminal sorting domain-containing protein [Flexibacter flexilis DSM 6793]|uniref:Conserved repeat domain-containing protein/Por secretion system C-terminal sorting domain-containing protein n=1 Tax=Flexibacter flexilis DSM 6793 TaxID=927664 RepID=A0A1I1IZF6_9BACT|nr:T9SS type A sorting domain-containing protein [Flexibacter flexilis]SFC41626.1 conserved repeat domain-containing protein/Por secretion system C-terminal sorting domain-containing protein [Flexibacter flexilis DSM 6793]